MSKPVFEPEEIYSITEKARKYVCEQLKEHLNVDFKPENLSFLKFETNYNGGMVTTNVPNKVAEILFRIENEEWENYWLETTYDTIGFTAFRVINITDHVILPRKFRS